MAPTSLLRHGRDATIHFYFKQISDRGNRFVLVLQMAPSDAYASVGSGKLKLKGVKDSKVEKRRKKKSSSSKQKDAGDAVEGEGEFKDRSVMLRKLEEEDEAMANEEGRSLEKKRGKGDEDADQPDRRDEEEGGEPVKTEAERRYDEQRRRRVSQGIRGCHGYPSLLYRQKSIADNYPSAA